MQNAEDLLLSLTFWNNPQFFPHIFPQTWWKSLFLKCPVGNSFIAETKKIPQKILHNTLGFFCKLQLKICYLYQNQEDAKLQ